MQRVDLDDTDVHSTFILPILKEKKLQQQLLTLFYEFIQAQAVEVVVETSSV